MEHIVVIDIVDIVVCYDDYVEWLNFYFHFHFDFESDACSGK